MSRCKCPKSDAKPIEKCLPYFEDITTRMEERRCDLLGRQKYLREKITTMERSIPALIAYNMWMSKKCDDKPYCKVREIMKRFAGYPDQTETLLKSLKKTVKELNGETEELHEKIIEADVKLEETDMELESLELANKEMFETLNNLEKEVRSYTTPSLHSIHSEDLLCLSKIRQLAQEELNLKNCIKELEQKETIFKDHMDRLLASKEYQSVCNKRKIVSCVQDLDHSGKIRMPKCLLRKLRPAKEKQEQEEPAVNDAEVSTSVQNIQKRDQETIPEAPQESTAGKRTSWIPNWFSNNQKSENTMNATENADPPHAENPDSSNIKNNETEKPMIVEKEIKKDKPVTSLKSKSKSAQCHRPCITPEDLECILKKPSIRKHAPPCHVPPCHVPPCHVPPCHSHPCSKPFSKGCCPSRKSCEPPRYKMADHGMGACQAYKLPCDPKGPCEICPSLPCSGYVRPGTCRCNCKGKCASGMSDIPCNCSDDPLGPSEEYRPIGSRQLADARKEEDSDDDFCDCCMCGCEDSDDSLCQCG